MMSNVHRPSFGAEENVLDLVVWLHNFVNTKKKLNFDPTGIAQWVERRSVKQRVAGLILSQGTNLGGRPGPW